MNDGKPFEAVIADMDGVLTRTATLHERAWKQVFDEFLRSRPEQAPFSSEDYRAHVDGKPRYDGVSDFMASRGVSLPWGDAGDPPDRETVCGLGNRKNAAFLSVLEEVGVEVFDDAVVALERWRRGGLALAAVSSSQNCRSVLRRAGLDERVDVIVDGQVAWERGLRGKPGIMQEAARLLGVPPERAVIVEDAVAGVRAGRDEGFGHVVGVARHGDEEVPGLRNAGAHDLVRALDRARFVRRVPHALSHWGEFRARLQDRRVAVFLDFDGTLAPIVDHPDDARIPDATRATVRELSRRCPVAIVSGRDRADVAARVDLDGLVYAGNHGVDIVGPDVAKTLPEVEHARSDIDRAHGEIEERIGGIAGVVLERKRYSIAVHYRNVRSESEAAQVAQAAASVAQRMGLRRRAGKKVFEIEPHVEWDKGRALCWLVDVLPSVDWERTTVVYAGDDETDEDGFAALGGRGVGVYVGPEVSTTLADYHLHDPEEIRAWLEKLAAS